MPKELKDMTKAELLGHIAQLDKTIAESGDAAALANAKTELANANKTIEELMGKVAALDAIPKVESNTVEIDGRNFKMKAPKVHLKATDGSMVLATIKEIKESAELQSVALAAGILVEVVDKA